MSEAGLQKEVSRLKRSHARQRQELGRLISKNLTLKSEIRRLEKTLVSAWLHPKHVRAIVERAIPTALKRSSAVHKEKKCGGS